MTEATLIRTATIIAAMTATETSIGIMSGEKERRENMPGGNMNGASGSAEKIGAIDTTTMLPVITTAIHTTLVLIRH